MIGYSFAFTADLQKVGNKLDLNMNLKSLASNKNNNNLYQKRTNNKYFAYSTLSLITLFFNIGVGGSIEAFCYMEQKIKGRIFKKKKI